VSPDASPSGGHDFRDLLKDVEIIGWSFEGTRLPAAPYIVFKELRQGWEAVPCQNFNAKIFPNLSSLAANC
jgi:hypothetical protein